MVYQVGRPAMLEGKRFLPEMGIPIWKSVRSSTRLDDWLPLPFTVATCRLKSLSNDAPPPVAEDEAASVPRLDMGRGAPTSVYVAGWHTHGREGRTYASKP